MKGSANSSVRSSGTKIQQATRGTRSLLDLILLEVDRATRPRQGNPLRWREEPRN